MNGWLVHKWKHSAGQVVTRSSSHVNTGRLTALAIESDLTGKDMSKLSRNEKQAV
jgi:hypothetical protein